MSKTPVPKEIGWYLSGYTDGEGCFCVSFSPRRKLRTKLEVRPSFSVSQNNDRSEVLFLFKQVFDCGSIRPDRSDQTLKYEVRSLDDLISKVTPFFKRFPLKSSKSKDFLFFSEICQLMSNKKPLKFLERIIELAFQMNSSGKRRYDKKDLQNFLKVKV